MIKQAKRGFTLIELLIAFALIGVLFAAIGPRIVKFMRQSGQAEIKFKLAAIKEALNEYKMEFGAYPTSREGLRALVENPRPNEDRFKRAANKWPFLKDEQITDKQGNEFAYNCPPELHKDMYNSFEILYLGPTQSESDPEAVHDGI